MRTATLGGGIEVGRIGLGCMGMTAAYDPADRDDATSVAVIHRAIDLGVTLIDTADVYGPHSNERLVGAALSGRRDQVVLATKAGLVWDAEAGRPVPSGHPDRLRRCCDESLTRLGVDVIDLWQLHRPDPAVPVADAVGAMAEMVAAGKVRALGVSEMNLEQLRQAHAAHPLASIQSELSLWTRGLLDEIVPWCAANGVAVIPFAPLGRGYLTGAIDADRLFDSTDTRARLPRFTADNLAANRRIVDGIRRVADRHGATAGQVALAWVLAQGEHVVPIPGTKRRAYLEENCAADGLVLDAADLADLDALPAPEGDRY